MAQNASDELQFRESETASREWTHAKAPGYLTQRAQRAPREVRLFQYGLVSSAAKPWRALRTLRETDLSFECRTWARCHLGNRPAIIRAWTIASLIRVGSGENEGRKVGIGSVARSDTIIGKPPNPSPIHSTGLLVREWYARASNRIFGSRQTTGTGRSKSRTILPPKVSFSRSLGVG